MRFTIDGKSLLLGTFAGAAVVAGLGAMQIDQPSIGHYHATSAGTNGATYVYVVDTWTGQVWREGDPGWSAPKVGPKAPANRPRE